MSSEMNLNILHFDNLLNSMIKQEMKLKKLIKSKEISNNKAEQFLKVSKRYCKLMKLLADTFSEDELESSESDF